MQLERDENRRVLASLARRGGGPPVLQPHRSVDALKSYLHSGSHPEIVERLWDQIHAALPADCRFLVHGTPALVHPSGLIFAVALGTQYVLRIPRALFEAAAQAGAEPTTRWAGHRVEDIRETYGDDWRFGRWLKPEIDWCRAWFEDTGAG